MWYGYCSDGCTILPNIVWFIVSVTSNEVFAQVFLHKVISEYLISSVTLSGESQNTWARLVKFLTVVVLLLWLSVTFFFFLLMSMALMLVSMMNCN